MPEFKYVTAEKEALAVVEAINNFRHYLLDKPFPFISDHRLLQWFEDKKENNGRLGRCRVGRRIHQYADFLSRLKIANVQLADQNMEICDKQAVDPLCMDFEII